ncbi:MAG: hypothetical protein HYT28_01050 [Parcubacteria group bacterium]|nr:hypothetical protein [Parcubacteria group bacterium]
MATNTPPTVGNEIVQRAPSPARFLRARARARQKAVSDESDEEKKAQAAGQSQKLTGAGFTIMILLALVKDFFDIIASASVVLAFLSTIAGVSVAFIIFLYLFFNNVSFTARKLTVLLAMFLIESVPFLALLPTTTISLLIVRYLEHNAAVKRIGERFAA